MNIEVLKEKYRVGCNKGVSDMSREDILEDLNKIIDWKNSTFPKKKIEEGSEKKEVEDRKFLGEDPKLSPGDVFLYKGQVIAVDSKDRLVLVVSETGPGALSRITREVVDVELGLIQESIEKGILDVILENNPDLSCINPLDTLDRKKYKVFKEKFTIHNEFPVKATITSTELLFPVTVYLTKKGIYFKKEENEFVDEDIIKDVSEGAISFLYKL